jgi:NAD(P)-dependent dehydrogenase (short-subunit alcohol dehydrogenase family)
MAGSRGWVTDKVAIVTGAGGGGGSATARLLAREGATVVLSDIDEKSGTAAAAKIRESGAEARFLTQDTTDAKRWDEVVRDVTRRHGRLDILVNNAGIQITQGLLETSLEEWRRVQTINAEAAFLGTQAAIKAMLPQGKGSIVNLSSNFGIIADALNAAYCASKASVRHFTKAAALDCAARGTRIRVNSIHPGCIDTAMLEREIVDVAAKRGPGSIDAVREEWRRMAPLGIGTPDDIGWAVVYLASDRSGYVTGAELVVDGGQIIR